MGRITIDFPELNRTIEAERGDNLLALMQQERIPVDAGCGGVGRCGRCRALIDGESRLTCLTHVLDDIQVRIPSTQADEGYSILIDYPQAQTRPEHPDGQRTTVCRSGSYAVAVDLGTTTVVGKLIDRKTGSELDSFAELNAQRLFGSDVISRINASLEDAAHLSEMIVSQLDSLVASMLKREHVKKEQVGRLVIAGNTAMSYLLLGLPCRSLGSAPFNPEFALSNRYSWEEVFHTRTLDCRCELLPFISAFVGGDATAGLCSLYGEDDFMLLDLGTNGEILFRRGHRLLCTATAAGPAFEGSGIECGSGSVRGAISAVCHENGLLHYRTIGASPAKGICGSGLLDLVAVLLELGYIDSTGYLTDKLANRRFVLSPGEEDDEDSKNSKREAVFLTQKDIRQFQLAKAAVRTGIEIACHEMGGDPPRRVYLAGGFGQALDPKSAVATGLIPESFHDRVFAIGNSSLNGAAKVCLNESILKDVIELIKDAQSINLATHQLFSDLFLEHMGF